MTGYEFQAMRKAAGIKQIDMAWEFGIRPESLSRIENGRSPVQKMHVLAAMQVIQNRR